VNRRRNATHPDIVPRRFPPGLEIGSILSGAEWASRRPREVAMLSGRMILPALVVVHGSWSLMLTTPFVPGALAGLERQERELACLELLREQPELADRHCEVLLAGPMLMPVRW
jgi:hypothetical protein